MLRNILSSILLRKKTISTLLLMIILLGAISYATFPKEEMPEVDLKSVAVIISYDGMSSQEIEKLITEPLEREFMALKDLDEIISISKDNIASFMVAFDLNTQNKNLAKIVRNTIKDSRDKLPIEMEIVEVKEYDSSMFSRIYIGLYGDVPYEVLQSAANAYKDDLENIGNVTEVSIKGEREEIIKITLDPSLLQKHNLNISDVYTALQSYNNIVPAGILTDQNADFSVKIPGLYKNYRQIEDLPINAKSNFTLKLKDIANVKRTYDRSKDTVIVNGKPALSLEVSRKSGTNILDTYVEVKKVLADNDGRFHPLIETVIVDDESTEIEQRIESSENTVITAVILVMIIVIAALGIRSGLIVGLSIPTTYLFSILILDYIGMTYNLMTVFGLILAVGLLVDGPIVITEFARAEQERGVRRRDSYINSSYTMFWPIIASALTTIAAFFPLLFWPDMLGQWLRVIPLTVIVVLSTSLIVTLIFLPAVGSMIERKTSQMSEANKRKDSFFINTYEKALSQAITKPITVLFLTLLTFTAVIMLYSKYNSGVIFFPNDKAATARVEVMARGNLSPTETGSYINEVSEIINANPYVGNYVANTISRNRIWLFDDSPTDIVGRVWLDLIPIDERPDSEILFRDIQEKLDGLKGFDARIKGNTYSSSIVGPKDIEIEVSATDKRTINQVAQIVRDKLSDLNGVQDVEIKYPVSGIEWLYDIDRKKTAKYNVPIQSIGAVIKLATTGTKIGTIRPSDTNKELDIKLFLPEESRTLDEVNNIFVSTDRGPLPISEFVSQKPKNKIFSIGKKNAERILIVDGNTKEGFNTAENIEQIRNWLSSANIPVESNVKLVGEAEDSQGSLIFVLSAFGTALLLMFIILISLFDNFYHTFLILFSIALSTTGIFVGLIVLQMPFSGVMTGLGIVACTGIVVNNNIILIDSYRKIKKDEKDKLKAIVLAAKSRIRPIFLTTVTTVFGLLPSALQISVDVFERTISYKSPETYFVQPLAWAIVFGLSFATVATLFVTPSLLALPDRIKGFTNIKRLSINKLDRNQVI